MSRKTIAVVVPCFNEEDGIDHLLKHLQKATSGLKQYSIDIILVDDGSSDDTLGVMRKEADKRSNVFFRSFSGNVGHQSALRAGIDACAAYDAVIMLDADMQHPPKLIPDMIKAWEDGAHIVQMVRDDGAGDVGWFKYATSRLYYVALNKISSINMEYGASDFRLIDRSVAQTVIQSQEKDLFLRGYFAWLPARRVVIPYRPAARFAGQSKYTFKKMLDLASKGVMQFSEKPLQLAMNIGAILSISSFVYLVVLILLYVFGNQSVSGWTSLMVLLLFCFGVNFILIGIIGRYLAHAIGLQKSRPDYIVAEEKLRS